MTAFSFLHAADIHLDSPLQGLETYPDAPVEQIRTASRRALDNLVDLAIDEQVAFVLLAGDVFDSSWRDYNTALFFAQRMGRLREAGIRVVMITGNHDAASTISKNLRPPDNVHVLPSKGPDSVPLDDLDVVIHGQGYPQREVYQDLAAGYPRADPHRMNIGLLHTGLNGQSGHEPYAPSSVDVLAGKGYDYWALGHIHQREVLSHSPWIVFPGIVQGRHIRETGPKGCALVRVQEGRVQEVTYRDVDVLRWHLCSVDVSGCRSQDELWPCVRQALQAAVDQSDGRPLAVRIRLTGMTELHSWLHAKIRTVREECQTLAVGLDDVWLEKLVVRTQPENGADSDLDPHSPLAGLLSSIQEMSLSEDVYSQLPELAALKSKLPPEILSGEDAFDPCDPEQIRQMQDEVRELLLGRLLGQGREG